MSVHAPAPTPCVRRSFLARLLLVHGHLSYKRNTKLILYSFYKSMVITFTQFYFTWFSAFSGLEIYDGARSLPAPSGRSFTSAAPARAQVSC